MPRRLPRPKLAIERFTLPNGLRVVINPDRSAPVVGIAVYYDVGFRSEPEGRTGFAHLFEHRMFQGSANLEKGEADRLIEGNGGNMNGSTHPDFTVYISQLPSTALELGLFLEADRMRSVRLTEDNLRNQIDVVKEEINVNVNNRPYGGFPWIDLPPVMFTTFNNAHNGYGSFVDLEAATVRDAQDFFDRYYAPGNAVLAVAGDVDVDEVRRLVVQYFGDIAARPVPAPPDLHEPVPTEERRGRKVDLLAPMPATAVGYRVPDPVAASSEYLAAVVLAEVLAGGEASRLYQRLVKEDRLAADVGAAVGSFGDPYEMRDPTSLQILVWHPGVTADEVLTVIDEEVDRLVEDLDGAEVQRVVTGMVSGHLRHLDNVLQRAMEIGMVEQQRGRAELVNELPVLLGDVTASAVAAVADRWLRKTGRAVLEVVPGDAA
ncbi:MAG TPA: pitrilysin family protein [Acidimicrobiales bacterium]|nr:pitrilysin family protein [Acidimicrobiales bacterium]